MKKTLAIAIVILGCDGNSPQSTKLVEKAEREKTREAVAQVVQNQRTPTDIRASLERHNLIKRAYWVNGLREKALAMPNPVTNMPLGYVVLLTSNGAVVGKFTFLYSPKL